MGLLPWLMPFEARSAGFPTWKEAIESSTDVWGEAALKETNGPSYEFFEKLLPPPRYVNADFKYYPIVLSVPNGKLKARLVSNGSGVNLRGGSRSWHDAGTPYTFRVGPDDFRFGEISKRLKHPRLEEGYLPIYQIEYEHPTQKHDSAKTAASNTVEEPEVYEQETFLSMEPTLIDHGVVFVNFKLNAGTSGFVAVCPEVNPLRFGNGRLTNETGEVMALFDKSWAVERGAIHAKISTNKSAWLAIFTKPMDLESVTNSLHPFHEFKSTYEWQRHRCIQSWKDLLSRSIEIQTPEPIVNNAWRNLIIQDFSICTDNRLNYSHGNQYQKMYAAETSDAAVPLMAFGFDADMRRFLPVILDLNDPRLTNHFASHKLDTVCRFYWQTRDIEYVKEMRTRWQKQLDWILDHRGENGLLPKDNYCTDIEQPVYSFSSNAKCWAALRDIIPVLEAIGDQATARRVAEIAPKYKQYILDAAEKSIRHETKPPFVPCALFGAEDIHDPITETRIGSYWDLVANYVIGSGIFAGSESETWIPKYFETHGGLFMGLTRSAAAGHTFWMGKHRTNPLYGMRYVNDCLKRDDVDRALINFYGMLAHGMTRNTFIGAEGCAIEPLDEGGRQFYCPPNTASNGEWLWTLRNLLVQDFDLNNDGRPETLRLAFATPRRWLEDGKEIGVQRAPTPFGELSFRMVSHLQGNEITATLSLPQRNPPQKIYLRARPPIGWKIVWAQTANKPLGVDEKGTVDLSGLSGDQVVRFGVERN